jgi:hypothetical protein
MRVAALVLGILGGLYGLSLSMFGSLAVSLLSAGGLPSTQRQTATALIYAIPIASLLGGGVALSSPGAAAFLMLSSAAGWFYIGSYFGYGINFVTFGSIALSGLGGLLALGAAIENKNEKEDDYSVRNIKVRREQYPNEPILEPTASRQAEPVLDTRFDRAKWNALLKYDADLAMIADKLRPLGPKWVEEFAASYLAINDKAYLGVIVRKIIADARSEDEERRQQQAGVANERRS